MKKTVLCIAAFAMSSVIYAGCPKVAGKYELTTRIYKGTCDMKNRTDKLEAKVIQKGCNITFDFGWGVKLRGKMKNRTATIKGSYDDDGGIKKSLKIKFNGRKLRGGGSWSYDMYGLYKCRGTEKITGTRQ